MEFIKRLLGMQQSTADRVEAAGERIATAAEQMADAWEAASKVVVERLGAPVPQLPAPQEEEEAELPKIVNGKHKRVRVN